MDVYVLVWVALVTSLLAFGAFAPITVTIAIAIYRLVDIVNYRIFFILVKSQERPWTADILRRSVLVVLLNFYECVVCFALLYLRTQSVQNSGGVTLDSPLTAFYYSLVTMMTLGYGDYIPSSALGRVLVIWQLATMIVFLIFLLPALMSVFSGHLSKGGPSE